MIKAVQIMMMLIVATSPLRVMADTFVSHCRDFPPELYFDGKKCIGVIPELVEDVLNELGHDIDWIYAPWIRSMKEAKRGNVDLLVRHSMTEQRLAVLKPINYGIRKRTLSFFKSNEFKGDITSYEDLQHVKLGAIRGVFYSAEFSKLNQDKLILVGRTEQLIGMLEMARIDVVVTSPSHNIDLFEGRFEKVSFEDAFLNYYYISIPRNSKAIRFYDDIARVMLKYRKTGQVNRYFQKYGVSVPEQIFSEKEVKPY
ncbi:transporter substrate-binding domain-containing protein [Aliiglaciecola sp. 2_MG-2023]|uniref:substrate-binding periplasmic protein n=1 Tax=unclassified Aliiglaciecola TaxID=2593648 RepID=UPI0026E490BE|nr:MULTISPECIES: transporter substrate-binding domain-containing protein [unclassified Aliiglaciecola]MDO6709578.1 transporter substrate-binding domain-containing protein [Aliiglaciecola sp. 2_MG-2023]MDO6750880.1 transporter substrate-binding domain-containing protein [Aliiglaciecola sp. 1_MG-2023]